MVQLLEDVSLLELVQLPTQQQGGEEAPVPVPGQGQVGRPGSLNSLACSQRPWHGPAPCRVNEHVSQPGAVCGWCGLTHNALHLGLILAPLGWFRTAHALCSCPAFPLPAAADHCGGADGHAAAVHCAGGAAVGAAAAGGLERPVPAGRLGCNQRYLQVGGTAKAGARTREGPAGLLDLCLRYRTRHAAWELEGD